MVAMAIGAIAAVVVAVTALAFFFLRSSGPPPAEVAGDPLLDRGYEVYMARCAGCHGEKGRGDGPTARSVTGPRPGDFTAAQWKHGNTPKEVLAVIRDGVPGTNMSGFARFRVLDDDDIRAVAAYVFRLHGSEVPPEFRAP
jgi:cytochrome c oxidase cbb3-type subunit 3